MYIYVPRRHFSPFVYLVISLPLIPQVPIPTRPLTLSGVANILFFDTPFFVDCKTDKLVVEY